MRCNSDKEIKSLQEENLKEASKIIDQLDLLRKENDETLEAKNNVIEQQNKSIDSLKKKLSEVKTKKETLNMNYEDETSKIRIEIKSLEDFKAETDDKIESLNWKKNEMEKTT